MVCRTWTGKISISVEHNVITAVEIYIIMTAIVAMAILSPVIIR